MFNGRENIDVGLNLIADVERGKIKEETWGEDFRRKY